MAGCGSDEEAQKSDVVETTAPKPEEYMKDPVFREKLAEQRGVRKELLSQRARIVQKLTNMSRAMQAKMPGASDEEVVAELEKDPEWNSLVKRVEDLVQASEDNRAETLEIVRERLTPTQNSAK